MKKRIAIIAATFHRKQVETMLDGAREVALEEGLTVVREILVPGTYEIPLALKRILGLRSVDGAVVLGIIEQGETKHGLVMGIVVHNAIIQLELETGKPVGKGILGPEILPPKIEERLKPYAKNAVLAVKALLNTF